MITLDIPGAFLHTDIDEEVVMLLRRELAVLMVKIDPEKYGSFVTESKSKRGEKLLYVHMCKAMYGPLDVDDAEPRPVHDRVPHVDRNHIGSSPDGARPVHPAT